MTPATRSPEFEDNKDIDWRAELQSRVGIVVVVLLAVAGVATMTINAGSEEAHIFGLALISASIVLFGILSMRRISPRIKSIVIITALSAASVKAYSMSGYLPGGAVTAAYVLILGALLIGRKTFITLLLAFTVLVIVLTALISTGIWLGPNPDEIDPTNPTIWIRTSLISVLLWGSLGFSVLFVVNTIEDNLGRRRAALKKLSKEIIERRAAESSHREAEEIAIQAQKMEAVGQFAAGIAHDFNNALMVISGWNDVRSISDATDEQRKASAAIELAVEHSAQLSRQLLTFARKDVRTPKYVFLGQLVEGASDSLQHLAGPNIEMKFDVQADALVSVDESQIQQLIFNLVINARDAVTTAGNIRVTVRRAAANDVATFQGNAEQWVVLEIEDDGPGIDEDTQKRVFEPFFTTKGPGKGTGLGLSTVHGIVQQSGGHIRVQSRPGRTVFSTLLPSASNENIAESAPSDVVATEELGLHVLVIEDDPLARQVIVLALQRNGIETIECDNGDAAMSLLSDEQRPFDVLCLDAVFPGAPLTDVVTAFERHSPEAKVLVCSGYVREELAMQKLESGEYAYLAKPFTGIRLIRKIHEIVGGTKRQKKQKSE